MVSAGAPDERNRLSPVELLLRSAGIHEGDGLTVGRFVPAKCCVGCRAAVVQHRAEADRRNVVQIEQGARRELVRLFWGLSPSWAKHNKGAYACINARSDSVAT